MKRHRILLADDHAIVLEGISKILEPHFDLVGRAEDGRALLETAQRLRPDAVVIDIGMPLLNGIDAARQLAKTVPHTKVVFLTMHSDPAYVREAFSAGASGYVLKQSAGSELLFALQEVLNGRYFVTPRVAGEVVGGFLRGEGGTPDTSRASKLTDRQREVLQLVAEGQSVKEIAATLDVSVKTVEFHKRRLMDQLGVRTTAGLTKYALTHGLISE
ncbi:MAG TPA: response regulator transcription factor [Vicinamibacteria bacterium]|jgi:DNA-binding NarL/FixJ family response regulator